MEFLEDAMAKGDENAILAYEMYNDRVVKYIGEYFLKLGGKVDAIVFTAGVGENGIETRADILSSLAPLGIVIDEKENNSIASYRDKHEGVITSKKSSIPVWVVPTNEELMIIRDTYHIVCGK